MGDSGLSLNVGKKNPIKTKKWRERSMRDDMREPK